MGALTRAVWYHRAVARVRHGAVAMKLSSALTTRPNHVTLVMLAAVLVLLFLLVANVR